MLFKPARNGKRFCMAGAFFLTVGCADANQPPLETPEWSGTASNKERHVKKIIFTASVLSAACLACAALALFASCGSESGSEDGAANGGDTGGGGEDGGNNPKDGGNENPDGGTASDAGNQADGGNPTDAGLPTDAGNLADAGHPTDAGNPADAGNPVDGGNPADGGSADAGPCNALDNDAVEITDQVVSDPTPSPTGGTIAEGIYHLVAYTHYQGNTHSPSTRKWTLRVSSGLAGEIVQVTDNGAQVRVNGTFAPNGTAMVLHRTCPGVGDDQFIDGYSVTAADTFMLIRSSQKDSLTWQLK
jgi:hypothetical protein